MPLPAGLQVTAHVSLLGTTHKMSRSQDSSALPQHNTNHWPDAKVEWLRTCARVCQKVNEHIFSAQLEQVVASCSQQMLPLLERCHVQLLNHLCTLRIQPVSHELLVGHCLQHQGCLHSQSERITSDEDC